MMDDIATALGELPEYVPPVDLTRIVPNAVLPAAEIYALLKGMDGQLSQGERTAHQVRNWLGMLAVLPGMPAADYVVGL